MSTRARIRSIKPEAWQDEKIGALSRDARLLMVGLITMADDEGRFRALPSLILGHVFPWDDLAPKKLEAWLREIESFGLIVRYEVDGKPYAAFRHWRRHQHINKPNSSVLPDPPDPVVVRENSRRATGTSREGSGSESGSRVRADRIGTDRKGKEPPLPPASGGRQRDRIRFEGELAEFCSEHFPGVPAGLVAQQADVLRRSKQQPTVEALRPLVERWVNPVEAPVAEPEPMR